MSSLRTEVQLDAFAKPSIGLSTLLRFPSTDTAICSTLWTIRWHSSTCRAAHWIRGRSGLTRRTSTTASTYTRPSSPRSAGRWARTRAPASTMGRSSSFLGWIRSAGRISACATRIPTPSWISTSSTCAGRGIRRSATWVSGGRTPSCCRMSSEKASGGKTVSTWMWAHRTRITCPTLRSLTTASVGGASVWSRTLAPCPSCRPSGRARWSRLARGRKKRPCASPTAGSWPPGRTTRRCCPASPTR
mmetsp:Transcript_95036/g.307560  ORF Transcript_95036/g.307560 Transcript_95036/m.307560 type:complete len:246 (+) Transcript_95036:593-1330(+)